MVPPAAGRIPKHRHADLFELFGGRDILTGLKVGLTQIQMDLMLHIVQHLTDSIHAHNDHNKVDAFEQLRRIAKTRIPGHEITAYQANDETEHRHEKGFYHRIARQQRNCAQSQQKQHKVFRRSEVNDERGNGGSKEDQHNNPEETAHKGADRGNAQRKSAASLLHQRVTVQAGDNGGGVPGRIDQDGSNPAAEHTAHINADEQRQAGGGFHGKGKGNHQSKAGGRTKPGQCADYGSHH